MVNKKKNKKALNGLVSLLFLVSIGLNIFQHQQIRKLSKVSNDSIHTENQPTNDFIPEGTSGRMTLNYNELEYQLDAAEEELDLALKQISDSAARKEEIEKKERELQEYLSVQGPSEENMRNSFISQYGEFFEELKLSPEKQEEIIDILTNNSMAAIDFSMEVQSATPSEEKRTEFTERRKVLQEKYEEAQEKIKNILGNTDYEKYQEYMDTMMARAYVNQFAESLNGGEKLTEQQQQRLITVVHEQSKDIYSEMIDEVRNEDTKFVFPSERETNYDYEEQMTKNLEYQNRNQEAYINAAQDILSASQIEELNESLQKEREQSQLMMEIHALRNAE